MTTSERIIVWFGTSGPEWRRVDGKPASTMTTPTPYEPAERIAELQIALRPFADIASVYDGTVVDDADPVLSTDRGKLTAGDLRRARAALSSTAKEGE